MASLSQQLSDLIDPSPTLIDPEDDIHVETSAKVLVSEATHENENIEEISLLRRQKGQNLSDINKRYSGIKVSRTSLNYSNDSTSEDTDSEEEELEDEQESSFDEEEGIEFYSDNMRAPTASAEEFDSKSDSHSSDNSIEDEVKQLNDDLTEEYINQFSNIDVSDQISKGKALKNQLLIWDNLLELRIKVQKILVETNKFPPHHYIQALKQSEDNPLNPSLKESSKSMKRLLDILLEMDSTLDSRNHLLFDENHLKKCTQSESNISEDKSNLMTDSVKSKSGLKRKLSDCSHYSELLSKRHSNLIPIRNDIIDKWYEKTRFTSSAFKQRLSGLEQSSTQQIDRILSDMDRLIARTQTKRSLYNIIGKTDINDKTIETNESNEEKLKELDPEIFDDEDFYHQLLRELIESKTGSDSNDPMVLSGKWLQIQKLRNKMKRKVDTKASKGRKIRYDVHSKLVNFMAPVDNLTYTEDAKTQLFSSLFGQKAD